MTVKVIKYTRSFTYGISGEATYSLASDYVGGIRLDTVVDLKGVRLVIAGRDVENFHNDLQELFEKYYI